MLLRKLYFWTDEEKEKLRVLWEAKVPALDIAKTLDRTYPAVCQKAAHLGLSRRYSFCWVNKGWTKRDNALLRRFWEKEETSKIALRLGRTEMAVSSHARALGLRKRSVFRTWTPQEDALLLSLWATSTVSEIAERLGRTYMSVKTHVYYLRHLKNR